MRVAVIWSAYAAPRVAASVGRRRLFKCEQVTRDAFAITDGPALMHGAGPNAALGPTLASIVGSNWGSGMNWLRSALARISAVNRPVGPASGGNAKHPEAFPGRPPFGEGEEAALSSARIWLEAATERDVAAFALGEERRFAVDQAQHELMLIHADGESLPVQVEALGSFNPHNRTFRWAWSNPSIDAAFAGASERARRHEQVRDFPSFSAPIFEATFDACRDMVAHAARLSGCDGVYRAINEERVSVFLGYRRPSDEVVAQLWRSGRASEDDLSDARSVVIAYDAAMLPFDLEYREHMKAAETTEPAEETRLQLLSDVSSRQRAARDSFWRCEDDQADLPLSWPSPHDAESRGFLFATPRRAGGVCVVRGSGKHHRDAFVLQRFPEGMRIVGSDLEWGAGLLWP